MTAFRTLERQTLARDPPKKISQYPDVHTLVEPHLKSFNAMKEMANGTRSGLLALAVADIPGRSVKDAHGNVLKCFNSTLE